MVMGAAAGDVAAEERCGVAWPSSHSSTVGSAGLAAIGDNDPLRSWIFEGEGEMGESTPCPVTDITSIERPATFFLAGITGAWRRTGDGSSIAGLSVKGAAVIVSRLTTEQAVSSWTFNSAASSVYKGHSLAGKGVVGVRNLDDSAEEDRLVQSGVGSEKLGRREAAVRSRADGFNPPSDLRRMVPFS